MPYKNLKITDNVLSAELEIYPKKCTLKKQLPRNSFRSTFSFLCKPNKQSKTSINGYYQCKSVQLAQS